MPRTTYLGCLAAVFLLALGAAPGASPRTGATATTAIDPTNAGKPVIVGGGNVENNARQVVRTTGGMVYIFAADDSAQRVGTGPGVARAWKGNVAGIPTGFSEVDGASRPTAGSSSNVIVDVDARLDRSGTAHLVYVDETTATLYYRTFSTATDTWGPRTQLATGVLVPDGYFKNLKRSAGAASLVLDANDVPHVVYVVGTQLRYVNRLGGAWGAAQTVVDAGLPLHPQLAFGGDGTLHVSWLDNSAATKIEYARLPPGGAWQAPEVVASSDVQQNDTGDQGPSIVVTTAGVPYVLWITLRLADAVRIKYRSAAGTWTSDVMPADVYTHAPQIYAHGDDIYAFLGHDSYFRFGYQEHPSGQAWSSYVALTAQSDGTLDGSASLRWDPAHDNDTGVIDATFFDEDRYDDGTYRPLLLYMGIVPPGSPATGDTTPPTVSLTAPTSGSTVSGTVQVTATASDDVGVVDVQFQIDGANLGAAATTAPYAASWDTATSSSGAHTVSAVARDAAGNRTTASVTVTVSNGVTATASSGLVAAYSFDAGSGTTVADSSGKSNNGTLSGATWSTAGKHGGALAFNGSSSSVSVPEAASLDLTTGMTLEAWVDPTALGTAWRTVVFKERSGGVVYSLYANQGTGLPVGQAYLGGERNALGTASVPLNAWTHLAVTYDGAALRLYVNGALASSTAVSGAMAPSTGPLRLGGNAIWGEWFAGLLDDVRVYNRALSASEIGTDMTAAVGGSAPPPPADTTPPSVSVTAPAAGSTVTGSVTVAASSSDDVGVAGVQFVLDGTNLGTEDTSAPYSVSWDTAKATNASHTLTAVARDAAGNRTTSAAVAVAVSNTAPATAASGLVAAYSLNAGSGTAVADSSGKSNNGTLSGATWAAAGKYGGALSFNGSSSLVTVPAAASLDLTTGMTIEAWVDPAALGTSWRTVVFKERSGGVVYSLYANQDTGIPVGQVYLGAERNALGATRLTLNVWTHLAVTYDGAYLRLYVNGTLVRTTAVSGSMSASTGALRLGGNAIWGEWFSGLIDEVRIYNRALSASEIVADMGTPIG